MKVIGTYRFGECGVLVYIDALPAELQAGMRVRQGDLHWTIIAIEMNAMPRSHCNGKKAGLLIKTDVCPREGELEIAP